MRRTLILMLAIVMAVSSCKEEIDPKFLIAPGQVSFLSKESKQSDIESLFSGDSIVRDTLNLKLGKIREQIRIYEKGGTHLLTLTPSGDSLQTISNIRIEDPRFKTKEGITLNSTFKDIETAYPISKVITALNNVVLILKDRDLYITISKAELPENIRYTSGDVEAVQIPDKARIKYLMVDWD